MVVTSLSNLSEQVSVNAFFVISSNLSAILRGCLKIFPRFIKKGEKKLTPIFLNLLNLNFTNKIATFIFESSNIKIEQFVMYFFFMNSAAKPILPSL